MERRAFVCCLGKLKPMSLANTETSLYLPERLQKNAGGKRRSMSSAWKIELQYWKTRIRH